MNDFIELGGQGEEAAVYEPPMLAEVGDYQELTRNGWGFFKDQYGWWGH